MSAGLSGEELKTLQSDVKSVKSAFSSVKVSSAKKGDPHFPLPMSVQVKLERPVEAKWYDVEELKVKLYAEPNSKFRVEVTDKHIPVQLKEAISTHIADAWSKHRESDPGSFGFHFTFTFIQKCFRQLISLCPDLLETYEGVDDDGSTGRRFALVKEVYVAPEVKQEPIPVAEEGDAPAVDPEEVLRKLRQLELAERKSAAKSEEERREADRKRSLAMEGRLEQVRPQQLSKKELEERKKSKQGVRQSKTGSRRKKYEGEGSAVEKAAGKKAKKKNK